MTKEKILEILRSATPANDDNKTNPQHTADTSQRSGPNIKIAARDIKINNNRVTINTGSLILSIILALTMAWIFFQHTLR